MRDNGEVAMTKQELDAIPLAPDSMRFGARWLEDSDPDGVTEPDGTEWKFLRIDGVLHKRLHPF